MFASLDLLEERLRGLRYLAGKPITECDWGLFVTLGRFDAVYHHAFKFMLRPLSTYQPSSNCLRDLYQVPGVAATVRLDHIVASYYSSERGNPNGIVAGVPALDFSLPHDRGAFNASTAIARAA